MKHKLTFPAIFTILLGLFLLIEGFWGLSSQVVFGSLPTNTTHAVIHIILGIAGIWMGSTGRPRGFLFFSGFLLLVVGALHFVPDAGELLADLLNVNRAVAWVNIATGALSIIIAMASKRGAAS